jgi:hypothetical protein
MSAKTIPYRAVAVTKSDTAYITDKDRTPTADIAVLVTSFVSNVITKASHGYSEGDIVKCTNAGTATNLTADSYYYVLYVNANTFSLALTLGGAVIALGTTYTTKPTLQRVSSLGSAYVVSGSLFVGGAGVVVCLPEGHLDTDDATPCIGGAVSFTVSAGAIIVGHFKKVFSTGTTATLIICQHE